MLSIDEAIARERAVAETCEYEASKYDMSDSYEREVAYQEGKCAEEHEQLAEWLEELKVLREEKSEFQIYAKDIAEANYEMGMEIGYKKAIDDAKSVILQTLDNEILVDTLQLRLEQLKERTENEFTRALHKRDTQCTGHI